MSKQLAEPNTTNHTIMRWTSEQGIQSVSDVVTVEQSLEIRLKNKALSVTMRCPGDDRQLTAGFLIGEGIIQKASDLLHLEHCPYTSDGNVMTVTLSPGILVDWERLTRHNIASSSCGLCGRVSLQEITSTAASITSFTSTSPQIINTLPDKLHQAQAAFAKTGGLHAAAIFDRAGELHFLYEDIGRHNAVDKTLGHALLEGVDLRDKILLVSGRVSFEIMQKALASQVPIIAAISAPSSLAIEMAHDSGQTLIGFLREGKMNIYTHPQRIA